MIEVRYNLNMVPDKGSPIHINVSQNDDKCRTFIFKLYSSDGSWTAPASATSTIEGRKDDGKFFSFACTYSNGEVTVIVQQQMVAVAGKVRCKIKLVSGAETIESAPFYFVVNPKSMPVNADMSKSDVVDAVAKATQKIVDQVAENIPEDYVKLNEDVAGLKSDLVTNVGGLSEKTYVVKMSYEKGYISGDNGILGINNINYRTANIINLSRGDMLVVDISKVNAVPHTYEDGIWKKYYTSFASFCADGYGALTATSTTWTINIIKNCDIRIVVSLRDNSEIGSISQFADTVIITKLYNYKRIDNLEKSVSELTTDTVLLKENKCDYPSILKKQNIDILDGVIRDDGVLVNIQDITNKHIEISINSHYDKGSVCVSGSCLWKNLPFLLFLNDSSKVLETYGHDTGKFYENYVIGSVPVGCTKIVVNCQTEVGYLQYLLKTNLPVEEYINNKIESKTKNDSYWTDKKIVWFGTSIPAGVVNAGESGGNGSYPVRIGEMLGATVYNESVGSSAVRIGMHDAITNDDINGYSGCPATCCLFSLSGTVDEKKEIISNWSTWKNKFSIGVETIDSIISRGEEQERIYDRSYEVKLSKYLSGGSIGQCDLYVIDHGYNDAGNKNGVDYSDLTKVPSDSFDRTYFIGAMNYIINKIKTDNFRASICIVSHYNDEGVFSNLVEAQRYVADYWNIPFIEIYDKIGFSTSSKITISGVTKTVKDWWLPDGIHPSSDTTGKALKHYAEVLYPLLRDVR